MKKLFYKIMRSEFMQGFAHGMNSAHIQQYMF